MKWAGDCSDISAMSMDPCEVPDAGEPQLSRFLRASALPTAAPVIGIGALDALKLGDIIGELSDLNGELLGLEGLTEEDDISRGGPGTRT